MSRRIRRLALVLLALTAVIGLALLLGKFYLASAAGGARVAARLEGLYGAPLQIGGVEVGFHHISLRNLSLAEAGPNAPDWAVIDEVQTDLTPGELLGGEDVPRHITLVGAAITLRFNRAGSLLTRLPVHGGKTKPGDLPEISIRDSRIVLKQEGRPDFIVAALQVQLKREGERLIFSGNAVAERWGEWSLAGHAVPGSGEAALVLRRPEIHFTQTMLEELPLVPSSTWKEVKAEGESPVELAIRYDPVAKQGHYRVLLQPRDSRVKVAAIDLEADRVRGEIVLEDGHVHLRGMTGEAAEGSVQTHGHLDFCRTPEVLTFAVDVQTLRLRRLPKSWSLPPVLDGRLTGHADLTVTLAPGGARTNGEGEGTIGDVRIGQAPFAVPGKPIRLKLVAKGRGFQFLPDSKRPTPNAERGAKTSSAPDYAEADLGVNDADLAKLLRGFGVVVPVPLTGRVTCQARLVVPLATARDGQTYRLHGTVTLHRLRAENLELADVRGRIDYRDGVLRLEDVAGRVVEKGRLAASARIGLVPSRNLAIRLTVEDASLGRLLSVLPGLAENASGTLSGHVDFRAPLNRLRDVTAWELVGNLASPHARVFGWEVGGGQGNFHLEEGVLNGVELTARIEGVPIVGSGRMRWTAPYPYEARMEIADSDPTSIRRLARKLEAPVDVAGRFDVTARLNGALRPLVVHAEGIATAPDLELDGIPLHQVGLNWQTDGTRLQVTDLGAKLFGGAATGDAVVPLTAALPGRLDLAFRDVDAGQLASHVAALPLRLEGQLAGTVQARLTAAAPEKKREITAILKIESPLLFVQRAPAERLSGTITYGPAGIDYQLAGLALDGRLFVKGNVPLQPGPPPHKGLLRLEGARLTQLWRALGIQTIVGPLTGTADLEIIFQHNRPDRTPSGTGLLALRNLRWDDIEMAGGIRGNLVLTGTRLQLQNLTGDLGEGVLYGHASYDFGDRGGGGFNLAIERVEAARLMAPWPPLGSRLEGPLDIQVRGRLGADWHGNGEILLPRGSLFGVEAINLRLPFDFEMSPTAGTGQLAIRDGGAQVARGRVAARASYRWGGDTRMETHLDFYGVQVRALLRSLNADLGPVGTGQLNGRLDLEATNPRTADDLAGSFRAALRQTQAQELPVVRQLLPLLIPNQSGSAIFTAGDLEIRLARGVLRIQRFRLIGPVLQMVIEGTATLQGRLDLDATANTSAPFRANGAQNLNARIPALGTIPLRLLAEATSLLAGRLLHVRVTGTWRSPNIRLAPVLTLTEEAVRFFLGLATRGAGLIPSPGG